ANSQTCKIFLPGTYTSANAPQLLEASGKANYFVSGLYNFAGVSMTIQNGALVYGGEPNAAAGDITAGTALSASGCKDFALANDGLVSTALQAVFTAAGVNPTGV